MVVARLCTALSTLGNPRNCTRCIFKPKIHWSDLEMTWKGRAHKLGHPCALKVFTAVFGAKLWKVLQWTSTINHSLFLWSESWTVILNFTIKRIARVNPAEINFRDKEYKLQETCRVTEPHCLRSNHANSHEGQLATHSGYIELVSEGITETQEVTRPLKCYVAHIVLGLYCCTLNRSCWKLKIFTILAICR